MPAAGGDGRGLEHVTYGDFAPLVDQEFRVDSDGLNVSLVLQAVHQLPGPTERGRAAFSLLFAGPAEPALAQQIHRLRQPDLGELDLFLVPIAGDSTGRKYEAIFN